MHEVDMYELRDTITDVICDAVTKAGKCGDVLCNECLEYYWERIKKVLI